MKKRFFFVLPIVISCFLLFLIVLIFENNQRRSGYDVQEVVRYEIIKKRDIVKIKEISIGIANLDEDGKNDLILNLLGIKDGDELSFAKKEIKKISSIKKELNSYTIKKFDFLDINIKNRIRYKPLIHEAAKKHELDPEILRGLITVESGFHSRRVSSAGAKGLAQLMPGTAKELGVKKIFNPRQNVMGGAKYLSQMIDEFGDLKKGIAAYNYGPSRVKSRPHLASSIYVKKVLFAAYGRRVS